MGPDEYPKAEDHNDKATIVFILDFFSHLVPRELWEFCCCYLQNRINTGATEREKRLKRREETNLLSVRLNGIPGEKGDSENSMGFIIRKMSSCYCLERALTLSDELQRPS